MSSLESAERANGFSLTGRRVLIHGLTARTDLNGMAVEVLCYDAMSGRFAVRCLRSLLRVRVYLHNLSLGDLSALSGDCLFLSLCALDPASLLAARAVCVSWRHAAVMVLRSPGWQADNLTARQLVLADAPAAALRLRMAARPREVVERQLYLWETDPDTEEEDEGADVDYLHVLWLAVKGPDMAPPTGVDNVQAILDMAPHAAQLLGPDGDLPLHRAVRAHTCLGEPNAWYLPMVSLLIGSYGAAVIAHDEDGATPLHHAAMDLQIECAHALLASVPTAAATPRGPGAGPRFGFLPLHDAVQGPRIGADTMRPPSWDETRAVALISMLLRAHPAAVYTQSKSTRETPLHLAVRFRYPPAIVNVLLAADAEKRSSRLRDFWGNLPVHYALGLHANRVQSEVCPALLAAHPICDVTWSLDDLLKGGRAAERATLTRLERQDHHLMPLMDHHLSVAAEHAATATVIAKLIAKHPSSVHFTDRQGRLPLHHAAMAGGHVSMVGRSEEVRQAAVEAVRLLLEASPETALKKSGHSGTAFDHAKHYQAPQDVLDLLSARMHDAFGNPLPTVGARGRPIFAVRKSAPRDMRKLRYAFHAKGAGLHTRDTRRLQYLCQGGEGLFAESDSESDDS